LIKYDGSDWEVFRTANSGISGNQVNNISFDYLGNKWLSTQGGVSVFKEGGILVSVGEHHMPYELPVGYHLYQNYPNPFNPATTIPFTLPNREVVKIEIYNLAGQRVAVLANQEFAPGRHELHWDAAGFASGVYLYRMVTPHFLGTGKLVLVK